MVIHLVQSPFCNGRVSLLARPTFLHKHLARFPSNKNVSLKFRKIHVTNGTVYYSVTDQTKATASWVIVPVHVVSRIQISGPGENNFVKWKGTFRSDRPHQIRSVSVKGPHTWPSQLGQGETITACVKAGMVTRLHETGFLHIKGIKISDTKL